MPFRHPEFPEARPLAIAHRAGNSLALARTAIAAGADMLETDVWPFRGHLEIRHARRIWKLPLLWDRNRPIPIWRHRLELNQILEHLAIETRIFLDLKGTGATLGERVVERIEKAQPERKIFLCGRTWEQLDAVASHPNVTCFYSVGDDSELASVWSRLETMTLPAISLQKDLATPEIMARLNALKTTVICWTVNDMDEARRLFALGVDGFTTDDIEMIARITRDRQAAMMLDSHENRA
ncbi:MAG: glycerophosphodiester phosphodiesterase [Thermomicrobiales bacterium]